MGKVIDIPDQLYAQLEQQAKERGLTVPEMIAQPAQTVETARIDIAVERIWAEGLLLPRAQSLQLASEDFKPIQVSGKPLSEVIIRGTLSRRGANGGLLLR